jgi:hypothetical protein
MTLSPAENAIGSTEHIVVRNGAFERFSALRADFAPEGVTVVWDRRSRERRRPSSEHSPGGERRREDRRGPIPGSWTLLDFVVVPARVPSA